MSSLAWIDFDEAERQRAQRIMALFQERESRDELGLGAIRDSIADHLFPGTSTIQTRLRYMLFIPWLFRMLEGRDVPESQLRTEARALEIRLADALKAGGESNGIIGRDAGPRLQRLPSSVYWAGLGAWGIRLFPGSIDSLFVSLRGLKRPRLSSDGEDAAAGSRAAAIWNQALPQAPKDLLDRAVFRLTADEAQFIIDRLVATQPTALLTMLAREGIDAECDHIWTHSTSCVISGARAPPGPPRRDLLARDAWGGAPLQSRAERTAWSGTTGPQIIASALRPGPPSWIFPFFRNWSLDDFWDAVEHPAHSIRPAAKRFVTQWLELVVEGTSRSLPRPRRDSSWRSANGD